MRPLLLLITLCFLALSSRIVLGQNSSEIVSAVELSTKIDTVLNEAVQTQKIPGAVVLVAKNGQVMTHKAYGFSKLFNQDGTALLKSPPQLSVSHLFDIASLTKTFTTTGILLLVDRGQLQLDSPVAKYLPSFNRPDKKFITVRQLLTHTSGLLAWYPMYYKANNKKEVYELIANLPLDYPTGKQRKYSDLGFTILGELIEVVSNKSLEVFMQQEIYTPLGMKNTGYTPLKSLPGRFFAATSIGNPYEYRMVRDSSLGFIRPEIDPVSWNQWRTYNLEGEVNDGNTWYASKGISGAAGIFSTAEDLFKLANFWLEKGYSTGLSIANKNLIKEFITPDEFKNGLGWMMDTTNSFMKNAPVGAFGHTGFTGTSLVMIPSQEIVIILLINRQQTGLQPNKEYFNTNPLRRTTFECGVELVR
jgi:CubicO group peptidase (beta-lactamase class C family)